MSQSSEQEINFNDADSEETEYLDMTEEELEQLEAIPFTIMDNQYRKTVLIEDGTLYSAYMENEETGQFYMIQVLSDLYYNEQFYFEQKYGKIGEYGEQPDSKNKRDTKKAAIQAYEKQLQEKTSKGKFKVIRSTEYEAEKRSTNIFRYEQQEQYSLLRSSFPQSLHQKKLDTIFTKYLPKKLLITHSNYKKEFIRCLSLKNENDYSQLQELRIDPLNAASFFRYSKAFAKFLPWNLKTLKIDLNGMQNDEDIDNKYAKLSRFIRNFTQLTRLELNFVQVQVQNEGVIRLGNAISYLKNLKWLEFILYESGTDRQSLNKFALYIEKLSKLEIFILEIWDEDQMPYKMFFRRFGHLKNFQLEAEDYDLEDDHDEFL